jgi:hypothetical protein
VIPVLLLALLSIVEGAFLFQSYLAIQHAARESARFAVTYQPPQLYGLDQVRDLLRGLRPDPAYPGETEDEWIERRVGLIKERAIAQSMGIRLVEVETDLDEPPDSDDKEPGFFGVYVAGRPDELQGFVWEHPGGPGMPIQVHVYYKWIPLDPLLKVIVPNGIMLRGQAEMINEGFQWADWTPTPAPTPLTPTVEGPTATPPGGGTPGPVTPEATATPIGSPTPTLTPTPEAPYILLMPAKTAWTEAELVQGRVEIHNHFPDGTYDVYWEDNCGNRTRLGFTMTTTGGSDRANMPPPSRMGRDFRYLCPPVEPGQTYQATLSTVRARTAVSLYVPVRLPDLAIDQIVLPESIAAGQAITVGVVISSAGQGVVSDTFDVDLYVNPRHTPVLPGQPGQTTAEGSSPKQWYGQQLPTGTSDELSYVILPSTVGDYELWAQVDTSDRVIELDEGNNIYGPLELSLFCSDQCDNFDPGPVDPKWSLDPIGAGPGSASHTITEDGAMRISGSGGNLVRDADGKSFLLHQGEQPGDWEMTVQVLRYPQGPEGAKAGLMARGSLSAGARYAAIAITSHDDRPALEVLIKDQGQPRPTSPCELTPIPGHLYDGFESNGEGVYLRISRQGASYAMSTSLDGSSWQTESCMQHTFTGPQAEAPVVPGIWYAPYEASPPRQVEFDRFRLCPPGSPVKPDVRPKPPLLKECGNLLLNPDLEPAGELMPWITGDGRQAVQSSADYSADPNGQLVQGHSMQFQLDETCPGNACQAWATQEFIVPDFISSTQPIKVEMEASLYSLVPADGPENTSRLEDKLWLGVRDPSGTELTQPVVVVDGGQPDRDTFRRFERDLVPLFEGSEIRDHIGESLRFRLYANNADGQGTSRFHVDQIRCDICTTILPPDPEPDKVYRLGGRLLVILEGRPTPMPGIEVWAIQLPDGTTPPEELGTWSTYSIQDSTYNMFNLNPGRYRVYAEVWVSGNLYTASTTIQVEAGATVIDVNLNLL